MLNWFQYNAPPPVILKQVQDDEIFEIDCELAQFSALYKGKTSWLQKT
jgi:hypothetical protein